MIELIGIWLAVYLFIRLVMPLVLALTGGWINKNPLIDKSPVFQKITDAGLLHHPIERERRDSGKTING